MKTIKQIGAIILASLIVGSALGFWWQPRWHAYKPADAAFSAEFREKPIQMGIPKPAEFNFVKDDSLKIYSLKGEFGIDEINRLDVLENPDADARWFEQTVKQSGGKVLAGSKDDFVLELQMEGETVYLRGRIVYAPGGRGVYKIFIIRESQEKLSTLESERFLYSLKFS